MIQIEEPFVQYVFQNLQVEKYELIETCLIIWS
jgi:hypothetical protein